MKMPFMRSESILKLPFADLSVKTFNLTFRVSNHKFVIISTIFLCLVFNIGIYMIFNCNYSLIE